MGLLDPENYIESEGKKHTESTQADAERHVSAMLDIDHLPETRLGHAQTVHPPTRQERYLQEIEESAADISNLEKQLEEANRLADSSSRRAHGIEMNLENAKARSLTCWERSAEYGPPVSALRDEAMDRKKLQQMKDRHEIARLDSEAKANNVVNSRVRPILDEIGDLSQPQKTWICEQMKSWIVANGDDRVSEILSFRVTESRTVDLPTEPKL